MKLVTLKAFLGLMCAAHVFIIPEGKPDSLYRVKVDKNRKAMGEPILLKVHNNIKDANLTPEGRVELNARSLIVFSRPSTFNRVFF